MVGTFNHKYVSTLAYMTSAAHREVCVGESAVSKLRGDLTVLIHFLLGEVLASTHSNDQ